VVEKICFNTETDLATGLLMLVRQLQSTLELREPIQMFIAGGMATHLYTGARVTRDVDAEFSKRFVVPEDLLVETKDGNMLYLDRSYNSTFALMHENYLQDAVRVPLASDLVEVFVLSPVDLIVSKIARYAGPDKEDIESLVSTMRVSADEIEQRATEALVGYVGSLSAVKLNLNDVLKFARANGRVVGDVGADDATQSIENSRTHAQEFDAVSASGAHQGIIKAVSENEVVQHVGQGKHVAWDRKTLTGAAPVVGKNMAISKDGVVEIVRQSPSLDM
jgi:hypothetical protein